MADLPAEYAEGWAEENAVYRTARKSHRCTGNGAIPADHAPDCPKTITPGTAYIEYMGEAPAYTAGTPHSMPCALQFGFIVRKN